MFHEYVPHTHYTHSIGTIAWNTRMAASYEPDDGSYASGRYVAWMIMILDLLSYFFFWDKLENYGALIIVLFFSNEMNLKLGAFGILLLT